MTKSRDPRDLEMQLMSLWGPFGTHSYLLLPLTLAQSHRFFSTLAGICVFKKKKNSLHKQSFSHFFQFALRSLTHSVQHQSHSLILKSDNSRQDFHILKKGRKKRQHPPSNTVYAEWSCVLWWQSIYTWEEGNWYWDLSNIAANEALPPGKLGKSWWTAEEIFMKAFPNDVKTKNTMNCTQIYNYTKLILQGDTGALKILVHVYKYLSCMQSSLF